MPTVLLTRAPEDLGPLAQAVTERGWTPVVVPLVQREVLKSGEEQVLAWSGDGWIVTSSAVISGLVHAPEPAWVACVGEGTARRLQRIVAAPRIVADNVESLARALATYRGQRALWPRAEEPTPGAGDALRGAGLILDEIAVYRNREPPGVGERLTAVWPTDAVALASPSAARRLAAHVAYRAGVRVVAIGESTRRAAEREGWPVYAVAARPSGDALVDALGPADHRRL